MKQKRRQVRHALFITASDVVAAVTERARQVSMRALLENGKAVSAARVATDILRAGLNQDASSPNVQAGWAKTPDGNAWVFGDRQAFVFFGMKSWQYVACKPCGNVERSIGFPDAELAMRRAQVALDSASDSELASVTKESA